MLKTLEIHGLRGFAANQKLNFAIPDGRPGSGLTVIVGANNTGKSTAVEAIRAIAQREPPSFTQGRRNQFAGDQVLIRAIDTSDRITTLKTIRPGSSGTEYLREGGGIERQKLLVLPARRMFNPYFGRSLSTRDTYMETIGFPTIRSSAVDEFAYRLFLVEKNRTNFDALLAQVIDPIPNWSIDQLDSGQHFLKIRKGDATHSSEGLGEGLIGLLYIIDALHDSQDEDLIAIDEPELSLHPALQRKLSALLVQCAATKQIVVSTHSPYFVGLEALPNGATVARVHVVNEQSRISQLQSATARDIFGLMRNENNPHILGLLAQEIFFVEDKVILVEGQEDVVFFKKVELATKPLNGTFFGWGVGGADNMERIATVLRELGFSRVVGVLDGNKREMVANLNSTFPQFHFFAIPANDVRTKAAVAQCGPVKGLLDHSNESVREEYLEEVRHLFGAANRYLDS